MLHGNALIKNDINQSHLKGVLETSAEFFEMGRSNRNLYYVMQVTVEIQVAFKSTN